ncbi:MAG: hypothetical protein J7K22_00165 [Nanoarchaeota archaeon]|nr:hypothetical protein [Nanoarchaeota archaeon]
MGFDVGENVDFVLPIFLAIGLLPLIIIYHGYYYKSKQRKLFKEDILSISQILAILSGTWIIGAATFTSLSNQIINIATLSPQILSNTTFIQTFIHGQFVGVSITSALLSCGIIYGPIAIYLWNIALNYPSRETKN